MIGRGITPAHAGNTRRLPQEQRTPGDHPRACGEYVNLQGLALQHGGSPPRMRGILSFLATTTALVGITPAHAGNTFHVGGNIALDRDHPRACGEYNQVCLANWGIGGSPPRMRGIPCFVSIFTSSHRITPAHAGNTDLFQPAKQAAGDHPRACGEYNGKRLISAMRMGSPPRMRGILNLEVNTLQSIGITPAHAGNTQK